MEVKDMEIMNRREYTKEFKQEAVELSYRQGGVKATESLGIATNEAVKRELKKISQSLPIQMADPLILIRRVIVLTFEELGYRYGN